MSSSCLDLAWCLALRAQARCSVADSTCQKLRLRLLLKRGAERLKTVSFDFV